MLNDKVTLSALLDQLNEESLFDLLMVTQRRARRQALRHNAGKSANDLVALRELQSALETAHRQKLEGVGSAKRR